MSAKKAAASAPAPTSTGPSFIEKPFIRQDPERTRLMFECRIASITEPEVTWFQNDGKIKSGGRYTITKKLEGENHYVACLDIADPNRKDAGKFEVKVKTDSGDFLEVYQFARDAAVAEAWLITQEPYLFSQELGHSVQEVERLIKKHESFEKSAVAQDDRFQALHRLTTLELKQMAKRRQTEDEQRRLEELRGGGTGTSARGAPGSPQGQGYGGSGSPGSGGQVLSVTEVEGPISPERVRTPGTGMSPSASRGVASPGQASTLPTGGEAQGLVIEGPLLRKHDSGAGGQKASDRSWISVYSVIKGTRMYIYREEKSYRTDPSKTFHGEEAIELWGCDANRFEHHSKKHAFRVELADASTYLFEARNDDETNIWIETMKGLSGDSSPEARSSTLPEMSKSEAKRRSLPWRKK